MGLGDRVCRCRPGHSASQYGSALILLLGIKSSICTSTHESTAPMGALCSVSSLGALLVILRLMMPACTRHMMRTGPLFLGTQAGRQHPYRLCLPSELLHTLHAVHIKVSQGLRRKLFKR